MKEETLPLNTDFVIIIEKKENAKENNNFNRFIVVYLVILACFSFVLWYKENDRKEINDSVPDCTMPLVTIIFSCFILVDRLFFIPDRAFCHYFIYFSIYVNVVFFTCYSLYKQKNHINNSEFFYYYVVTSNMFMIVYFLVYGCKKLLNF